MRTECHQCGTSYEVDERYRGQALTCTQCGREFIVQKIINESPLKIISNNPVLIEQTDKKFKRAVAYAGLGVILGATVTVVAANVRGISFIYPVGYLIMIVSGVSMIIAVARGWWHHG